VSSAACIYGVDKVAEKSDPCLVRGILDA